MELSPEADKERREAARQLAEEDYEDTRKRLIQEILEAKDDLFWWWNDRDLDQSGRIHVQVWVEGMQACCQFKAVSWYVLNRHFKLTEVDKEGCINYVTFLQRYQERSPAVRLPPLRRLPRALQRRRAPLASSWPVSSAIPDAEGPHRSRVR